MLSSYYSLIQLLKENQTGTLWSNLTDEQKNELLQAYDESFELKNLVNHEEVKLQHEKWLEKKFGLKEPVRE